MLQHRTPRIALAAGAVVLTSCVASGPDVAVSPSPRQQTTLAEQPPATGARPAQAAPRTFVHGELLTPGTGYRVADQFQDIEATFTAPSETAYAQASPRFAGLSTDAEGRDVIVALLPAAGLRVFPAVDIAPGDLEPDRLGHVTEEAPADIVAWLAERPFLDAGPIQEGVAVDALLGRGFAYDVRELPAGARACGPSSERCAPTIWSAGRVLHVRAGQRGHVLELDVAGQPLLAIVRDVPAATQVASSLSFHVPPVPAEADGAHRLPYFTPALEPGRTYFVDKVGRDTGLVFTAPAGDPVAASQRPGVAWLGDPDQPAALRHYVLTVLDASRAVANGAPSLNPYALVRPGGIVTWELERFRSHTIPLPDDPVRWLTERPYVVVEEGAHDGEVAGHPARIADVRAARLVDGLTCPDGVGSCVMPFAHRPDAFPIVLSSEYVTRVADVTIGDRRLLIAADLGTPGEAVFDSLRSFPLPME